MSKPQMRVLRLLCNAEGQVSAHDLGCSVRTLRILARAGYATSSFLGSELVRDNGTSTRVEVFRANTRAKLHLERITGELRV